MAPSTHPQENPAATGLASEHIELIRRVEEASMNAWPASHQMLLDGWLIRLSNGFTKRANCVVPLYHAGHAQLAAPGRIALVGDTPAASYTAADHTHANDQILDKIRYCENLYAREQLRTVFRLSSHPASQLLDKLLQERGYTLLDPTRVQQLELPDGLAPPPQSPSSSDVTFQRVPADEWLHAYGQLAAMPAQSQELHANLIRAIRPDCAFGLLVKSGEPIACALGVLEHELLGLFDVITAPDHRNQGHAAELLQQLLAWGAQQGAKRAYLQVIATNTPALRVYARLGFSNLYSYWYRQTR